MDYINTFLAGTCLSVCVQRLTHTHTRPPCSTTTYRQAFSLYVIDGNVAEISHQVQSGSQVNNVCASHRTGQRAQ
eukprot:1159764-Pelagomonas_calceolata.AAC.12